MADRLGFAAAAARKQRPRRWLRAGAVLAPALLAACAGTAGRDARPVYDVVIRGGHVLDGAGNPWIAADVAIADGRFVAVGRVAGRGRLELDATGKVVTPGWIDMMDHSGYALADVGLAENKVRMGVTTAIGGEGGTPVGSAEIGQFLDRLARQGISINWGTYYSATQARREVMGDVAGTPNAEQMAQMRAHVVEAMRAGAFGLATALIYPPGSYQTTAELVELVKAAAPYGGRYATHLRSESEDLLQGIDEAIAIGAGAGVPVEIFHLKAAWAPGWGKLMRQAGARIEAARARGIDIAADLYPYTAGGTYLPITVPNHVFRDGLAQGLERLKDPALRARLRKEVAAGSQPGWSNLVHASGGWNRVVLANAANPEYARFEGRDFAAIGRALRRHPADAAWDILLAAQPPGGALALFFMMSEADIETALRFPWTSIGSDAAATLEAGKPDVLGLPHPRSYGTFPRVIAEYVRKRGVLTLPDAIRKMTSWPAARMGLDDRGVIRAGLRADVVVFDYERIADKATWQDPNAFPEGIDHVLVNGVPVVRDGRHTGATPGHVLRGPGFQG